MNSQIQEVSAFQQSLYDLERAHQKMKLQYEEEIHRLRRELETRGAVGQPGPSGPPDMRNSRGPAGPGFPDGVPPPVLGGGGTSSGAGAFGGLLQGALR